MSRATQQVSMIIQVCLRWIEALRKGLINRFCPAGPGFCSNPKEAGERFKAMPVPKTAKQWKIAAACATLSHPEFEALGLFQSRAFADDELAAASAKVHNEQPPALQGGVGGDPAIG